MRRKAGALLQLEVAILEAGADLHGDGVDEFHGYVLAKRLQGLQPARRLIGHGTLYKALERLEAAGLLASRWEDPQAAAAEGRPRRRLYRLTTSGRTALARTPRTEPLAAARRREGLGAI